MVDTASKAPANPFIEHPATFGDRGSIGGEQWKFRFANGYGASVVRGYGTYGVEQGLWEIAVLGQDGRLTYDTPITDDVIGHQSEADVREVLRRIAELPAPAGA